MPPSGIVQIQVPPEMKSLPRISCEFFRLLLLAGLGAVICLAQSPSAKLKQDSGALVPRVTVVRTPRAAVLRSVRVTSDAEGPAVEIRTSAGQALNPTIE